ncbi:hypothetical protein [Actinoplanes sp. NPDC049265]|uniref:hypothetical protein n=1 Tax=Actinoplanes sp. NPDC049265 TaxID=3363902 RepID=UPI00371D3D71
MATAAGTQPTGFAPSGFGASDAAPAGLAAFSRAVVAAAADLIQSVERAMVGEEKLRTAQRNAWDALCADRARAEARDDMDAMVRAMLAATTAEPALPAQPTRRRRAKTTSRRVTTDRRR